MSRWPFGLWGFPIRSFADADVVIEDMFAEKLESSQGVIEAGPLPIEAGPLPQPDSRRERRARAAEERRRRRKERP